MPAEPFPEVVDADPPYDHSDYVGTRFRGPKEPLVIIPATLSELTGPAYGESAAIATEVTGDAYRYEPLPRQEWIDYRRWLGRADWSIEAGISYYDDGVLGEADVVSDDFELLTGRPAKSIRELIEIFRDEMPLSGTGAA